MNCPYPWIPIRLCRTQNAAPICTILIMIGTNLKRLPVEIQ